MPRKCLVCSGAKFVYLRRAAALLEMALCNYALQKVAARGFIPMMTPDLVRASVLEKCGFQPRAENTQVGLPQGTRASK
jgi:seryl-tRNA synthetase